MIDDWGDGWAKTLRLASEANIAAHEAAKNAEAVNLVARKLLDQAEGSVTITEFLTARYDEEEAVARRHTFDNPANPRLWNGPGQYPVMTGKSLLADVAAKRAVVALHEAEGRECGQCSFHELYEGFNDVSEPWPCLTLRLFAQPYVEHPDFDPAWRVA